MTVTLTVTVSDSSGNETVATKTFETGAAPLVGDVSGTFGDCFVAGDLNLTGDLFIEGLMTGVDTFTVEGNGFSVFFQNGGRVDLHGKVKARWGPWGTDPTGWAVGDRIVVAPTAVGIYQPSELLWVGGWPSMPRPSSSPDVTLVDGTVARPEVANVSQSIVFENLGRGFHFHDSAGVTSLSDAKFLNCGTAGVLGNYPVHFHLLGDNSQGSVLERVVVEGGKNHAFVPHGSHGISFPGCVAYNTTGVGFWWDKSTPEDTSSDSNDINWDDCLSLWSKPSTLSEEATRLAGFWLGRGTNLSCQRSVAAAVQGIATSGSRSRSGFHWPENASLTPWEFRDCVAHNNAENGIFTWQNTTSPHFVEDFIGYHNGYSQVNHGAYQNRYRYSRLALTGGMHSVVLHSNTHPNLPTPQIIEDVISDRSLRVEKHNLPAKQPTYIRRCIFPGVVYDETANHSMIRFEDCGLIPSDFDLAAITPLSIIEIFEGGTLTHRWAGGWS